PVRRGVRGTGHCLVRDLVHGPVPARPVRFRRRHASLARARLRVRVPAADRSLPALHPEIEPRPREEGWASGRIASGRAGVFAMLGCPHGQRPTSMNVFQKDYLMTAGPTPLPPPVSQLMAEPILYHRSPVFIEIYERVLRRLRTVFQ